jgi:hypothetical protein
MAEEHGSEHHGQQSWPVEEGSYVGRHWNGDLSLPISFWLNGVVLNIVIGILVFVVVYAVASSGNVGATVAVFLVIVAVSIPISVWQLVGIWRSAEKHKHFTGRKGWAIVAQVLVVLGWIGLVYNTFDSIRTISSIS